VVSTASFTEEGFASEQIRGLVRQVFLSGALPARQVVFTSIQPEIDVQEVCRKVGHVLAGETAKDVVIVTRGARSNAHQHMRPFEPVRGTAHRLAGSLWSLELPGNEEDFIVQSLHACMEKIRHEFDYSLIATSPGASDDARFIGQISDGIVLVLSEMRTRRAVALRFRNALEQSRLLGTVLIDREFPVPAAIYKRL